MAPPCPPTSSTSTSTASTRSSTGRAGSPRCGPRGASSRCPPSRSPTTARSPARSSSTRRRAKQGVKPIVGCEVYVADDRTPAREGLRAPDAARRDNEGYANLIKLSSLGYLEGYYYKPRVDWELLQTYSKGLIALSGCLSGRVCKALEENRPADARDRARPAGAGLRARQRLRRAPERAPRRAAARPAAARRARRRGEAAARRDRRRPLPQRRRRPRARGAPLHPVRRLAEEPEPLEVRHRRLLFQDARGDGARLPRPRGRDAAHARGRRALQRRDRARQDPTCRSSRRPTAATRSTTSSSCASAASSAATTR